MKQPADTIEYRQPSGITQSQTDIASIPASVTPMSPPANGIPLSAQPHFGSLSDTIPRYSKYLLPTLPLFSAISGVFLVGFLAQDIVGMWVPRIGVSLKRGAEPYDVWSDPKAQGLPPFQFFTRSVVETAKRWNWPNFWEEAGREFATGPGIFIIPTTVYALLRSGMLGKDALQMSLGDIRDHKNNLVHLFKNAPETFTPDNFVQIPQVEKAYKEHLAGLFKNQANAHLLQQNFPIGHQDEHRLLAEAFKLKFPDINYEQFLKGEYNIGDQPLKNLKVQDIIDRWADLRAQELGVKLHQNPNWPQRLGKEFKWVWDFATWPVRLGKAGLEKVGVKFPEQTLSAVAKQSAQVADEITRLEFLLQEGFKQLHRTNDNPLAQILTKPELQDLKALAEVFNNVSPETLKKIGDFQKGNASKEEFFQFLAKEDQSLFQKLNPFKGHLPDNFNFHKFQSALNSFQNDEKSLFYQLDNVAVSFRDSVDDALRGLKVDFVRQPIAHVFESANKLKDIMAEVYQANKKQLGSQSVKSLAALTEDLYGKIAVRKAGISLGLTLISGMYLFWLSQKVQKNNTYPANRLLQLTDLYNQHNVGNMSQNAPASPMPFQPTMMPDTRRSIPSPYATMGQNPMQASPWQATPARPSMMSPLSGNWR